MLEYTLNPFWNFDLMVDIFPELPHNRHSPDHACSFYKVLLFRVMRLMMYDIISKQLSDVIGRATFFCLIKLTVCGVTRPLFPPHIRIGVTRHELWQNVAVLALAMVVILQVLPTWVIRKLLCQIVTCDVHVHVAEAESEAKTMSVIYVIVIARGQEFMGVNEPSPRAQPEDKVCLCCHKSMATRAITIIYPT